MDHSGGTFTGSGTLQQQSSGGGWNQLTITSNPQGTYTYDPNAGGVKLVHGIQDFRIYPDECELEDPFLDADDFMLWDDEN